MSIETQMLKQRAEDAERKAYNAINMARNAMEAVKIAIEEDDTDEALRLIREAMGDDNEPSPQMDLLEEKP